MFNPLAEVISAIDNVRQMRAADEAAVSLVALQAGALAALAASRANPTPATRAAAVAASAALSAATLPPKARGYSNRAGKRQHDEQHARTAEAMRRLAGRNKQLRDAKATQRAIPLTPPGPAWSQSEYIACRELGIGFAAHRYGEVYQVFHYGFPDGICCTSIIVSTGGVERYIDHPFTRTLDWIERCSTASLNKQQG
jgi:hypothetical protein